MSRIEFKYPDALVTTQWLQTNLDDSELRVFDCTTYLHYETGTGQPYSVVSGRADYNAGHIPGSAFLDIQQDLSDNSSPYRFTVLGAEKLAARFAAQGIGDETHVVLYSRKNMQWATRVWWMLRFVGFDNAAILDGGWEKWSAEGRPVTTEQRVFPVTQLTARTRPDLFVGKDSVLAAIGNTATCAINALAPDLHSGENSRYGRPGRIPGSVNVPAVELQQASTREFLPPATVAARFVNVGADPSQHIIAYCGGGIAATLVAFLLHQLGYENISVYDNSMSEWAKDESLPIETD